MTDFIARSYLFVPATRADRVAKALASGADTVIVDLEDAVPPADKVFARDAAARELPEPAQVLVRVNGPESTWLEEDLRMCMQAGVGGIVLPKTESAEHVAYAASRLPRGTRILPLIETGRGFAALASLCSAAQVQRLVFGTIDFQLDMGIEGEGDELLYFRSGLVLASRVAGLQPPVDGVTVEINDDARVREDTMRGKRLGFGAKLCIHPKQVALVNDCFRPSADEVEWANRIARAAQAANGAAVAVDGNMVDRPVILKAEEILREAARFTTSRPRG
jgi:citrate lyase subunit beta/citryl-CoA lyase